MARILQLIASDQRRGAETFAVELAAWLTDRGHGVSVVALERSDHPSPLDVQTPGRSRSDPRVLRHVVGAARRSDLIVSFGSTSLAVGALASSVTGTPFMYRNIGDPLVWGQVRWSGMRIGAALRRAAGIVALYPEAARTLADQYRLDPTRITVIPRGVPVDKVRPATPEERARARAHFDLEVDGPVVAYVGSLSSEKDPATAVSATLRIPGATLIVAGDGPLRGELAASLPTPDRRRVRFLGSLADITPVYAAADALLLPSRTEGIPGVAIEAGLAGLPVIATAVGGVPHVIDDDVTGRLVPLDDGAALDEALKDVLAEPNRYAEAARTRCEQFFGMAAVGAAWDRAIAAALAPPPTGINVLQVAATATRRGAETFACDLGTELATRKGFAVRTVAVAGGHETVPLPIRVLGPSRLHPATLARLIIELRRCDVAIVHGSSGLWPTVAGAALTGRPFIYRSIGDPSYWGGRIPLAGLRVGAPLRRAAAVVALYPASADYLVRSYRLDPRRVATLPNAVDIDRLGPATSDDSSLPDLAPDVPVVAYVGAFNPEKRPLLAIESVALLPGVHLVMVGDGPLLDQARQLAEASAPGRVHLLGSLATPGPIYRRAQVTLLTSETEGMPAAVIESIALGTPVVATSVGAVPDLIDDGAGIVVADADAASLAAALERVLSLGLVVEPSLSKAFAEGHSLSAVGDGWADLLRRFGRPSIHVGQRGG